MTQCHDITGRLWRRYLTVLMALHTGLTATPAQDANRDLSATQAASTTEAHYRYADATQLWRLTNNAAGLSLDSSANRGTAYFDIQHAEGDYTRVQQGGQRNQLSFFTERYQQVGKLLVAYGAFHFGMDRTKERAWCDVMRPYLSNPYYAGSSVKGKYDSQQFDLTAAVGTVRLWGVTAGLRTDYSVGDLSRLRDPRSRSQLLDYCLTPALTYATGSHILGLTGHYRRRKEKIPGMTTVQTDPNLKYYLFTGLEQATGTTGGYSGFSREWVDHRFGAAVNYDFSHATLHSLSTATIERGSESVLGQYRYEPGHYTTYRYGLGTMNRMRTRRTLHQLDIDARYEQGYADEYRQQLQQQRDAGHGYTSYSYQTLITFKKRYQLRRFDGTVHYRCSLADTQEGTVSGYAGASVALLSARTKHLLPASSLDYDHLDLTIEGGHSLLSTGRLWVDASATWHKAAKADLTLADEDSDVATGVLRPDMAWYDADAIVARLQLTWQMPLTLKGHRTQWFARAYGHYAAAAHDRSRSTAGLSIGIYY